MLFFSSFAIFCFKLKHLLNLLPSVELAGELCYNITVPSILFSVDLFALNWLACSSTCMYLIFYILLFFYDFKWSKTCSFAVNIIVNISFVLLLQLVVIAFALCCPCSFASTFVNAQQFVVNFVIVLLKLNLISLFVCFYFC